MKNIIIVALSIISLSIVSFVSCGNGGDSASKAGKDSNVVEITINSNDQMRYDLETIEVPAGKKVKLTLVHTGSMAKNVMGHNWVLLAAGTDFQAFATAAVSAMDTDYIPASMASSVIAHTDVIGGGSKTTIEFDAPAAGTYDFLCSFPGHSAIMKGKFIVK